MALGPRVRRLGRITPKGAEDYLANTDVQAVMQAPATSGWGQPWLWSQWMACWSSSVALSIWSFSLMLARWDSTVLMLR